MEKSNVIQPRTKVLWYRFLSQLKHLMMMKEFHKLINIFSRILWKRKLKSAKSSFIICIWMKTIQLLVKHKEIMKLELYIKNRSKKEKRLAQLFSKCWMCNLNMIYKKISLHKHRLKIYWMEKELFKIWNNWISARNI